MTSPLRGWTTAASLVHGGSRPQTPLRAVSLAIASPTADDGNAGHACTGFSPGHSFGFRGCPVQRDSADHTSSSGPGARRGRHRHPARQQRGTRGVARHRADHRRTSPRDRIRARRDLAQTAHHPRRDTATHRPAHLPTASVDRLVRLRDRHCTFPGCAMPAARCDLDHIVAFNHNNTERDGAGEPAGVVPQAWKVQRSSEGETVWSAPTGHRYVTTAEGYAA